MAIAFRATAQDTETTGTSVVISKPTGTVDNDVMIAVIYLESSAVVTPPSGWTEFASGDLMADTNPHKGYAYWKRAASEGSSYTWSWTGSAWKAGTINAYSGCETSGNPYDVLNSNVVHTSQTSTATVSTTTTVANTVLVWGATNYNAGTWTMPTTPGTFTQRGTGAAATLADYSYASAAATGNIIGGIGTTAENFAFVMALKVPGGGGGSTLWAQSLM
jgi:hypothetical protein